MVKNNYNLLLPVSLVIIIIIIIIIIVIIIIMMMIIIIIIIVIIHEKFLQFDWLRAVVFQLNLK